MAASARAEHSPLPTRFPLWCLQKATIRSPMLVGLSAIATTDRPTTRAAARRGMVFTVRVAFRVEAASKDGRSFGGIAELVGKRTSRRVANRTGKGCSWRRLCDHYSFGGKA